MKAKEILIKHFDKHKVEYCENSHIDDYQNAWDAIYAAMREYAKEKCREQRIICNEEMSKDETGDPYWMDFGLKEAPEPNFD